MTCHEGGWTQPQAKATNPRATAGEQYAWAVKNASIDPVPP
jgi:hypothetical protein